MVSRAVSRADLAAVAVVARFWIRHQSFVAAAAGGCDGP
jgi:hypothetical protein